mmetsp:Transcript_13804/g.32047  ORF Transcript_13804/g.32047 Transcript_13804/m.32047 type:complete len:106 (-) Transcript_13804:178-495(-)
MHESKCARVGGERAPKPRGRREEKAKLAAANDEATKQEPLSLSIDPPMVGSDVSGKSSAPEGYIVTLLDEGGEPLGTAPVQFDGSWTVEHKVVAGQTFNALVKPP